MFTFIYKQFFISFFLFVEIKIAIIFEKFFAILIIKICNFVVLCYELTKAILVI